jgi:hypothetical protein
LSISLTRHFGLQIIHEETHDGGGGVNEIVLFDQRGALEHFQLQIGFCCAVMSSHELAVTVGEYIGQLDSARMGVDASHRVVVGIQPIAVTKKAKIS